MTHRRSKAKMRTGPKGNFGKPQAVRVRLLGTFSVSVGERTIPEDAWRLRKAAALLNLLAMQPEHRLHREVVLDLLWPDSGTRAAANNLRYVLHQARRIMASS